MRLLAVFTLTLISSCGVESQDKRNPMADFSKEQMFTEPHPDGNSFACNSCHALNEPALDGVRRAGHQVGDAYKRTSFKNGQVGTLLAAVNSCREEWMTADAFMVSDTAWMKLSEYLKDASEGKAASALSFSIVDPPSDLTGGNADEGMEMFNSSCAICHGTNATGTERAPAIAGTELSAETIAKRIRTSGSSQSGVYDGLTGGRMPFFAADRISDDEIRDVIAYLEASEAGETSTNSGGERVNISLAGATTSCGSDHALVGKTLTFSTKFHQVAGTATVVDNCTIDFDNFTFDGMGIDVRVYTGTGGDFSSGQSISEDLLGMAFSDGSARLNLPSGVDLDDFDSLSIWCVPVGISFGDGAFM